MLFFMRQAHAQFAHRLLGPDSAPETPTGMAKLALPAIKRRHFRLDWHRP